MQCSRLFPYFIEKHLIIPTLLLFLGFRTSFDEPLPSLYWWQYRWAGVNENGASISSANEPAKDLILVHTVQLKPIIKAHFSGRMVSSGISDVLFASVHSVEIIFSFGNIVDYELW